jgi:hypothetical protein
MRRRKEEKRPSATGPIAELGTNLLETALGRPKAA